MRRFHIRVDMWVDADDRESCEQRVKRLLNRLVADGLGTVDCEKRYPVTLSHWKLGPVHKIRVPKEAGEPTG